MSYLCTTTVEEIVNEDDPWDIREVPCLKTAPIVVMSEFMEEPIYVCREHIASHIPHGGTLFVMFTWWEDRTHDGEVQPWMT